MVFGSLSKLVSAPLMRLGVKGGTALLKKLGMKAVKEGAKKLGQKAVMSAASHAAKPATAYVTGKLGKLTDSVLSKVPAPLQPHAAKAIKEMTEKGGDMLALHTPSAMNASQKRRKPRYAVACSNTRSAVICKAGRSRAYTRRVIVAGRPNYPMCSLRATTIRTAVR